MERRFSVAKVSLELLILQALPPEGYRQTRTTSLLLGYFNCKPRFAVKRGKVSMEVEEEAWRGRISKLWEEEKNIGCGVGGRIEVTEEKMAP